MTTEFLVNHLWQSSCFVLVAAMLTYLLRRNPPKVRYLVWLSASLKFLVPWAVLVSLGNLVPWPARQVPEVSAAVFPVRIVEIARPFTTLTPLTVPANPSANWVQIAIGVVWALGFVGIAGVRWRAWTRVRKASRAGTRVELSIPVPAIIAPFAEEPGIVGFLRPVLVLPTQLLEQLTPKQLDAILAHEHWHVRRHDNFFAAVHMVVESIFWFHPLVWWIGARMVEERELACDEEVIRMGCEPTDYAQGILTVCRLYQESSLPCVSGVTGADVKKRLRVVLAGCKSSELTIAKKAVLAAIGAAALVVPVVIGTLDAPKLKAQSPVPARQIPGPVTDRVEAAGPLLAQVAAPQVRRQLGPLAVSTEFARVTIKKVAPPFKSPQLFNYPHSTDGQHFEAVSSVHQLIQWAYGMGRDFQVSGGPEFIGTPSFDDAGKRRWPAFELYEIHGTAGRPANDLEMRRLVQALLADRFKLKVHRETREIPIYAMVIGPRGATLPPETEPEPCPVPAGECGFPNVGGGTITARGATMAGFATLLTNNVDRPVIDKTGITGGYSFDLPYEHSAPGWRRPTIFMAIEGLGLSLEPQTETMEVLVIDSAERPVGN